MNETTEILKVDEAGRVRTPRAKQEEILDGLEKSGMTGAQFARHIGVKYPTLMNWVQRRRRERSAVPSEGNQTKWLEAVVEPEGAGGGLTVEVPGGVRLKVGSVGEAAMAAQILRLLGFGQPC